MLLVAVKPDSVDVRTSTHLLAPGRIVALVVALLTLSFSVPAAMAQEVGSSAAEERAQARVFEALDLMDAGSYSEARLLIKVALELNPSLDRAWYYLAQCDVELGMKAEATEALDVYEGRDLTEYERTQVAELRKRVVQIADEADEPPESGAVASTPEEPGAVDADAEAGAADAKTSEPDTETAEAGADTSSASAVASKPALGPGPVLLIAGGVVAAIGVGFAAAGRSMAEDASTYGSGKGLYYAGLGMAVGGGVAAAVGVPLTILAARKSATVTLSWSVDPGLGATSVWVSGRW